MCQDCDISLQVEDGECNIALLTEKGGCQISLETRTGEQLMSLKILVKHPDCIPVVWVKRKSRESLHEAPEQD